MNSFFRNAVCAWNIFIGNFEIMQSIVKLKDYINSLIRPNVKSIFGIYDPVGIRFIFQLRLRLSPLRSHKWRHNFIDTTSDICHCKQGVENTDHFLLYCSSYTTQNTDHFLLYCSSYTTQNTDHFLLYCSSYTTQNTDHFLLYCSSYTTQNTDHFLLYCSSYTTQNTDHFLLYCSSYTTQNTDHFLLYCSSYTKQNTDHFLLYCSSYTKQNTDHFLLYCSSYTTQRASLIVSTNEIILTNGLNDFSHQSDFYLYGHSSLSVSDNKKILLSTITFIKDSQRFMK